MNKLLNTLSAVLLSSTLIAQVDTYPVNAGKSSLAWHAEKVTGSHDGNVAIKEGYIVMKSGKLHSAYIEMDMTSITCTDIEDAGTNAKLVGHLKSDDFFSVEKHPVAKLEATKVSAAGANKYKVNANMTIKGITNPIEFTVELKEVDGILNGTTELTIDRTKYDIRYGSGSFFDDLGDKTIYDEFTIKVKLTSNAKS